MSLDTLALRLAGRLASRRHRLRAERGTDRSDDAILRWPGLLRQPETAPAGRQQATNRGAR